MSIKEDPFPGMDHFISLEEGIQMTTRYRRDYEKILTETMKGKDILPRSETFNREAFDKVLAQGGCEGIRLYYSMDEKEKIHIIAVGVDAENRDILPLNENRSVVQDMIIENGARCPINCPPDSELNS